MAGTSFQIVGGAIVVVVAMGYVLTIGAQGIQDAKPMAPDAHPAFEVATIKHSDPDDGSRGFHTSGRNIFIENETMDDLISFAYGVHSKQIVDAPAWFGSERLDIKGIPANEPVFVIRAKDRLSGPILFEYARMARESKCKTDFIVSVEEAADNLASWPIKKIPD